MNILASIIFRIALGTVLVAQYFLGGNYGQGNKFLLLIGGLIVAYGLFSFAQFLARKR
jgi:purine-cytosine permease-like protein